MSFEHAARGGPRRRGTGCGATGFRRSAPNPDSDEKKGESLLASTPVVVLSTILGRTPTIDEYVAAVDGIKLTSYAPPEQQAGVDVSASSLSPRA